jgi:UDP-GlcNAc:undecaprenyl-phosphate GlcNAc-1-phosphate transferase
VNPFAQATLAVLGLSFLVALTLTPLVRSFARDRQWLDQPDGTRKTHTAPVPRIGGVAVYAAFVFAGAFLVFFGPRGPWGQVGSVQAYVALVIAGAAVVGVGLLDDLKGASPWAKLGIQALAGLYLYSEGYRISALSNPFNGESVSTGWLSLPLTLLWFVAMSNAFNLIDGLDGLAAGIGLFSTTTLFIASVINARWEVALMATALGGALLGFLRYNVTPASIFLGDCGSLFVGFALAAIALRGSMKSSAAVAVAAPLLALAVPILDAGIAVMRRAIGGRKLFEADGDHIHHRMLRLGLTPHRVVLTLYAVAALFGALSLLTMTERGQIVGLVVLATSIVTWVGIQQLGYSEFGELQRVLRQGIAQERLAVGHNLHLRSLQEHLIAAVDLDHAWRLLAEAADRLGFDAMRLEPGRAARQLGLAVREWQRGPGIDPMAATAAWSVPLDLADGVEATLKLIRPLGSGLPQFESSYLVETVRNGFLTALQRHLDAEAGRTRAEPGRPGVSIA